MHGSYQWKVSQILIFLPLYGNLTNLEHFSPLGYTVHVCLLINCYILLLHIYSHSKLQKLHVIHLCTCSLQVNICMGKTTHTFGKLNFWLPQNIPGCFGLKQNLSSRY